MRTLFVSIDGIEGMFSHCDYTHAYELSPSNSRPDVQLVGVRLMCKPQKTGAGSLKTRWKPIWSYLPGGSFQVGRRVAPSGVNGINGTGDCCLLLHRSHDANLPLSTATFALMRIICLRPPPYICATSKKGPCSILQLQKQEV
jgi:hypothetical protein